MLTDDIIQFFQKQNFTVISTIDRNGWLHNSCKGMIKMNKNGRVYLLDLYKARTYENLKHNSHIAVTAVDEHRFRGFCLKGKARIISGERVKPQIIKAWEKKLNNRITQRVLKNLKGEKGHQQHPEALFPKPEYMIVMQVQDIVDLTPHHLK
jgi:general stress protein 26